MSRLHRLAIAVACVVAPALGAQQPPPAPWMMWEVEVAERWLYGAQQPRHVRMRDDRHWVALDSVREVAGGGRRLWLDLGRLATGRDAAVITVGADGRVVRTEATLAPFVTAGGRTDAGHADANQQWRFFRGGQLGLPDARSWDLVPVVRAATLRRGARWVDTLQHEAARDAHRQALRGVRTSVVLGDTMVDGRRLWRIRDSAAVRFMERWAERERTLDTMVTVERTTTGTIRGTYLLDPALRLARTRHDTTALAGEAVLRYPDGRTFRAPVRHERIRARTLHDSAGSLARRAALDREYDRTRTGMVHVRAAGDPPAAREESDSARIAQGDTALLYQRLARAAYNGRDPVDTADLRPMLAFMRDPGRAFAWGQSRDWLYENLRQALTTWPPAVATTAEARRGCTPAACRMLGAQWRGAEEPRLRDVGLIALFATDPRTWTDTLLARAREREASARFLLPALMLVDGVGANWRAASKAPLPPPGADHRAWLEWMNGRDPAYRPPAGMPDASRTTPRFEGSHATAIRFTEARTGRDVTGELRRAYREAASDSVRYVYGVMLQGLGALQLGREELAAMFRSRVPEKVALARSALRGLLRDSSVAADPATAALLVNRALGQVLDTVTAFAPIIPRPLPQHGVRRRAGPELHARRDPARTFLLADSLPPGVAARWTSRARLVTGAEWGARPLTEGGVLYRVGAVRRVGAFAYVQVRADERMIRAADESPVLYASGTGWWVMELDGEWVVVGEEWWVT